MWVYNIVMVIGIVQAIYCIGAGIWEALTSPGSRYRAGFYWLGPIGNGIICALVNFCSLFFVVSAVLEVVYAFKEGAFEPLDYILIAVFAVLLIKCVRKIIIKLKIILGK